MNTYETPDRNASNGKLNVSAAASQRTAGNGGAPYPGGTPLRIRLIAPPVGAFGSWAFLAFAFLTLSRFHEAMTVMLGVPAYLFTIALAFVLPAALLSGRWLIPWQTVPGKLLIGFTLWMIVGFPFYGWKGGAFKEIKDAWMLSLITFMLFGSMIGTLPDMRRALKVTAFSVIVVLLMFIKFATNIRGRIGIFGSLANANDLAMHLLIILPMLVLVVQTKKKMFSLTSLAAIGSAAYLLVVVMRTGSRAGLLGLGFYLVAIFLLSSFANKAKLIVGGAGVLIVLFATAPESAMDRYRTLWDDEVEEGEAVASARGRGLLLKESIRQTLLHPVFGLGPANFQVAFAKKMESEGQMHHRFRASHNTYTQVSSETGIPGFLMFFSLMVWCFWQNLRLYRQTNRNPQHKEIANMAICLFLSLLVFSVTTFFGSNAYRFYLPVLAGLTVSLKRVADEVLASGAGQPMPVWAALWPPPTPRPPMTSRPVSLT